MHQKSMSAVGIELKLLNMHKVNVYRGNRAKTVVCIKSMSAVEIELKHRPSIQ